MNTLFMSDPHLGHENICNFRTQFNSSKEHDECLRDNYHSVVRPKDTVWFNGDVAFTPEALEDLKSWNGVKHLVLGNHDNAEFKSRGVSLKMLQEVFGENIHGFLRKYSWWLSHCPIHPDELRGRMNVHGHIHGHLIDDPRYFNICMEHIDYTPISLESIRKEFESRASLIAALK